VERQAAQGDGIDPAREPGQGAREGEGDELGPDRADGIGGRTSLVVADSDHGAPDAAASEVAGQGDGDEEAPEAEEVEGKGVVEAEAPEDDRAREVGRGQR